MYPYLSADIAAAHIADLRREAAASCCVRVARHPVTDRIRALRCAAGARRTTTPMTPVCCPA